MKSLYLKTFGPVFATRRLALSGKYTVTAKIGKPRKSKREPCYYCPYQIKGIGAEKIRRAYGEDSMQALILALQCVAVYLYISAEYRAGILRQFPDDESRDLGFPVPDSIKDLYPSKKISKKTKKAVKRK
jgi:hypothetical protein